MYLLFGSLSLWGCQLRCIAAVLRSCLVVRGRRVSLRDLGLRVAIGRHPLRCPAVADFVWTAVVEEDP